VVCNATGTAVGAVFKTEIVRHISDQSGTLRMHRAAQRSRQRPRYLQALEELDQIALLRGAQTEGETGIVVIDHG
jgi:hypothetical protein